MLLEVRGILLEPVLYADVELLLRREGRVLPLEATTCQSSGGSESDPLEDKDPVEEAVARVAARMHGIDTGPPPLGPVLTSRMEVDGSPTEAQLDTGSPVSIIALEDR